MTIAAVLTVSDACFRGEREDQSGPAVARLLTENGYQVGLPHLVPDEPALIERELIELCRTHSLVVTTGGTGLSPRDVTPEATLAVADRRVDGLAELMRSAGSAETPFAALSRSVCVTRGHSLILNLPGSPRGAISSLTIVLPLLGHALQLLAGGKAPHPQHSPTASPGSIPTAKDLDRN